MEFISCHVTSLVINSLGSGYTDTDTDTDTDTHTHTCIPGLESGQVTKPIIFNKQVLS